MKINIQPIREWFGFTRRERRASLILLILIVILIIGRYLVPDKNIEFQDVTESIMANLTDAEPPPDLPPLSMQNREVRQKRAGDSSVQSRVRRKPLEVQIIDLNKCDSAELVKLPGIGPVLSARIIRYRSLLGGFASVEQLKEVYGLPAETYLMIEKRVFADTAAIIRIDINSAGYRELARLHYLERYEVSSILKYRELNGPIGDISVLVTNKLITAEKAGKVRPYLSFGKQ
jgi:DNA uptake protein ComE-like DNA-binding protein